MCLFNEGPHRLRKSAACCKPPSKPFRPVKVVQLWNYFGGPAEIRTRVWKLNLQLHTSITYDRDVRPHLRNPCTPVAIPASSVSQHTLRQSLPLGTVLEVSRASGAIALHQRRYRAARPLVGGFPVTNLSPSWCRAVARRCTRQLAGPFAP